MTRGALRLVERVCAVCDWSRRAVEPTADAPDCPLCHAPTKVAHEEWLVPVAEVRAQARENGRVGGLKGGRVRAERLTRQRRREIARAAAAARWHRR
jgi:hypothetical protein